MTDNISEGFGNVPNPSAEFRNVPQDSESFGAIPHRAERTEHHTLTVREVARMFEQANVPRTERSIINWCQPNRQGIARLDAFFDTNERKYFITPQSVSLGIKEEQSKAAANAPGAPDPSDDGIGKESESGPHRRSQTSPPNEEMIRQVRDLEIATRAKDYYIERLEKERGEFVDQLVGMSRYVGELETQLLQLGGAPRGDRSQRWSRKIGPVVKL